MKRSIAAASVAMGLLALAACSTAPPAEPRPQPSEATRPAEPAPPAAEADMCGASKMQHLVGKPRSEIPVPVKPELQRVVCTTCAMTMDYRQDRLNFLFDAQTGIIKEVRCG